jgi:hypothetical protein
MEDRVFYSSTFLVFFLAQEFRNREESITTPAVPNHYRTLDHRSGIVQMGVQKYDGRQSSTSETLANFYQTTRRNNPEDSHLHTRRRENLKSQI